ncbi:tungstate ABC transporter substrate-binding protein WtpA [Bacteroidota bacterium]
MNKLFLLIISVIYLLPCSVLPQNRDDSPDQLIIFHAGSLTIPFERIIDGFETENPGIQVIKEIAGSRSCARKITELNKQCDIMASADYTVIDNLLIPNHADWNIKFASNEMALVYIGKSRRAEEINEKNWFDILLDENINFGRSDPNSDPCGYRTVLTIKLSEIYYENRGLTEKLINKNTEYIRPKETDLIALLESGELDYIFIYRSVAEQHGLKYLVLPDEINLKNPELNDYYSQVSVEISGKRPGEKIVHRGKCMVYGFTIPKDAPNPELAEKFVHYLLNEEKGLRILNELGQPTIVPSYSETYNNIPVQLKRYATQK